MCRFFFLLVQTMFISHLYRIPYIPKAEVLARSFIFRLKKNLVQMLLGNGITIPFQLFIYFQTGWQSQEEVEGTKTLTLVGCYLHSAETITFVGWLIEQESTILVPLTGKESLW